MRGRVTEGFGLLVDFLDHEVAVIALIDQERRRVRFDYKALGRVAGRAAHLCALSAKSHPVAILQVAD